ncbi:MAG: CHAT domain-containing tetratricopeptide repeat protein [Blastocatellia bacterium]
MKQEELAVSLLATDLLAADDAGRTKLLKHHTDLTGIDLAHALEALFYDTRVNDPTRAGRAATALDDLANALDDLEVKALADWINAIAALEIEGKAELAIARLDLAAAGFARLGQPLQAAATQVSKLWALALLGRYDEALDCGLEAREIFLAHKDRLSVGKIEHNLGNIYFRRDRYREAEHFYRSARARFEAENDEKQCVLIDTNLATALIFQHKFRDAARLYKDALAQAEALGLGITQAVIECDLGCLALFQGRYDQALDYLEKSRRRYSALGMTHESAIAEQEIANAYLELNLAPEAAEIYGRITPTFDHLGMRAEQARALVYHGRASLLLGETGQTHKLLASARTLYAAEGNIVGEAFVTLAEAQLYHATGNFVAAARAAARAESPLAQSGAWERLLLARWILGEAARAEGETSKARKLFDSALGDAELHALPQLAQRCHTSLGLLHAKGGFSDRAEASFKRAIELIEDLRALLPGDEFRTAFVSDKLTAYIELVRLCLDSANGARVKEAFGYVERSRARGLADLLSGSIRFLPKPRDRFESKLFERLEELREELNWFYSQINLPPETAGTRAPNMMASLHASVRERESAVLEITRQLQHRGDKPLAAEDALDVAKLQRDLGPDTALVEYFSLDGELLAFIVTDEDIKVTRYLGRESEVSAALERLRFQIDSLRYGAERMRNHLDELTRRARHHLTDLYDLLLEPIEDEIGERRLVVVPYRALHYVPFHALYDGCSYVIERREVCYAPSANVLRRCLAAPQRAVNHALLLGVSDAQAPRVREEIFTLAPLFPSAKALTGESATLEALRMSAAEADVLHLACHGKFRSDNPMFSSLRLADGWLTVQDAYSLQLKCGLAVLSACETGLNAVAPGDEMIGLARGFFSAGALSLIVTLWTVDDEETAALMAEFYKRLLAGHTPAAALRYAQLSTLERQPHPFFWSPFVLMGRW